MEELVVCDLREFFQSHTTINFTFTYTFAALPASHKHGKGCKGKVFCLFGHT